MTDLTPDLQNLVLAGRLASRATEADRARVLQALHLRLGVPVADHAVMESAARLLSGKAIGIAVAGFALLCAGVARLSLQHDSGVVTAVASAKDPIVATSVRAVPTPPASSAAYISAPLASAQLPEDRPSKGEIVTAKSRDPGRAPSDQLSEEADILLRAETELHAGRAEAALKLLGEHERRFARGLLAEERTAATIQALCSLGRTTEATARLSRLSSASLHGERARQACGLPRKDKTN